MAKKNKATNITGRSDISEKVFIGSVTLQVFDEGQRPVPTLDRPVAGIAPTLPNRLDASKHRPIATNYHLGPTAVRP